VSRNGRDADRSAANVSRFRVGERAIDHVASPAAVLTEGKHTIVVELTKFP